MHTEALAPKTRAALKALSKVPMIKRFYLAGGTATALYLGHRFSHDLDFFSQKRFDAEMLRQKLEQRGNLVVEVIEEDTLLGKFEGVKISFFYYQYPLLYKSRKFDALELASPRDIAAMKVDAIAARGKKRDFVDLYWLIQSEHWQLVGVLSWFKKKYKKSNYNIIHALNALAYFEDAEKDPQLEMTEPLDWEQVKAFFRNAVKSVEL